MFITDGNWAVKMIWDENAYMAASMAEGSLESFICFDKK